MSEIHQAKEVQNDAKHQALSNDNFDRFSLYQDFAKINRSNPTAGTADVPRDPTAGTSDVPANPKVISGTVDVPRDPKVISGTVDVPHDPKVVSDTKDIPRDKPNTEDKPLTPGPKGEDLERLGQDLNNLLSLTHMVEKLTGRTLDTQDTNAIWQELYKFRDGTPANEGTRAVSSDPKKESVLQAAEKFLGRELNPSEAKRLLFVITATGPALQLRPPVTQQ